MKKLIITLVLLAVIWWGVFLYMTRPVSAPSGASPVVPTPIVAENVSEGNVVYTIDASQSEAKFEINEVLNSEPFRVVGTTKDVSGQITLNMSDFSASSVGTISINARTLKTDAERRDGMIGRVILKSEANEFITFTPKNFSGLPTAPTIGTGYAFDVSGTLTVAGTSKDITFSVKAKASSEDEIQWIATASINYPDFSLTIPKVPFVASVEDQVDLTFTFVAKKK